MKRLVFAAGLSALLAMTILVAAAVPMKGGRYRSDQFGLTVAIPEGRGACVDRDFWNHGVYILLDGRNDCSATDGRTPRIIIFGAYNVPYEARSSQEIAAAECAHDGVPPQRAEPVDGLSLGGREAFGCRQTLADGTINLSIFVLRKTYPLSGKAKDFPDDWVEIGAWLVTNQARFARDFGTFKALTRTVEIDPDATD